MNSIKEILLILILIVLISDNYNHLNAFEKNGLTIKVIVLNFDPLIPERENKQLHLVYGWNDPRKLAEEYISDIKDVSRGYINYKIVEWNDLNVFPAKIDGYVYTSAEFIDCWEKKSKWHQPDSVDYEKIAVDYDLIKKIKIDEIDEVWIFGAPYFGYWESAMLGPGAFYINGGIYDKVSTNKPFVVMGFNYERGVAEMIHDLSHRTESTMTRIYGGWAIDQLTTTWAKFAANEFQSNSLSAVGTCHYPPNGERDYDYKNTRSVRSNANDWLNFPFFKGDTITVNCETWGGPDYHRNYMKWWFSRLPNASGVYSDGRLNNWWEYVFNYNKYDETGKLKN